MKKLLLAALLLIGAKNFAATVDVSVTIDEINKRTTFSCSEAIVKSTNQFNCACEQFALKAQIVNFFEDGLTIEFKFIDKNDEVISNPIFRLAWGKLSKISCEAKENVFFELSVVATK